MNVRTRVTAVYVLWAVAALGTTLRWTTNFLGQGLGGQSGGGNGTVTMLLAIAAAALVAWWDRDSRLDPSRLRVAGFAGGLAVAVIGRNVYDIVDAPTFSLSYGIWVTLGAAGAALGLTMSLSKSR